MIENLIKKNHFKNLNFKNPLLITLFIFCISFKINFSKASDNLINFKLGEEKLPVTTLQDINKNKFNLNDLDSKNLIINFWATWCLPCLEEMPSLLSFSKQIDKNEILIVLVNLDRKFNLDKSKYNFDLPNIVSLYDPSSIWAKALKISGLPTTLFVHKNQKIYSTFTGPLEWTDEEITNEIYEHFGLN